MNLVSQASLYRRTKGCQSPNVSVPPCQRKNRRHPKHCPDVVYRKGAEEPAWAFVVPVKRGKKEWTSKS